MDGFISTKKARARVLKCKTVIPEKDEFITTKKARVRVLESLPSTLQGYRMHRQQRIQTARAHTAPV